MSQAATIVQQPLAPYQQCPLPVQLGCERLPPVFGVTEPTSGLPAALRRLAYGYPDYDARHWLLLLVADRVESGGTTVREAVTPGEQRLVLRHFARQARAHPTALVATIAGLVLVGLGVVRLVGRRRMTESISDARAGSPVTMVRWPWRRLAR
jgi:hypothetical protein